MTEIRKELERLIELNHAEKWVPNHIAFQPLIDRHGDLLISGLIECLADEDAEVRQLAAGLLEEAGTRAEPAVLALTKLLTDEDRSVLVTAIVALKRLAQFARSAIPALKKVMDDTAEPYLRIVAAGTISKIDPSDASPTPVLVAGLKDSESLHRVAAIEFLGERRSKSAVLNAMTLLSDEDFLVRFSTGKAIGTTFGNWMHATAVCVAMLRHDNETNRAMGAECLLSIRRYVGDHLDLLSMAMADCSWQARLDIEEILEELKRR